MLGIAVERTKSYYEQISNCTYPIKKKLFKNAKNKEREVCKTVSDMRKIEQWDIFELEMSGPSEGNPFHDVQLQAVFTLKDDGTEQKPVTAQGFYDGDGIYRIRFMPLQQGTWRYVTLSSSDSLDGITGEFVCTAPSNENHGMVRTANKYHFAFDDGSRYYPFGTTCYAWIHQGDALEEETLRTLRQAPFNKVRMCVFPKNYVGNSNEPQYYPFGFLPECMVVYGKRV